MSMNNEAFTQCCFNIGPPLKQHWVSAPCLLGIPTVNTKSRPNGRSMLGRRLQQRPNTKRTPRQCLLSYGYSGVTKKIHQLTLDQCCSNVYDACLTLNQQWAIVWRFVRQDIIPT